MKRLLASLMFMTAVISVLAANGWAFPGDRQNPDIVNYSKSLKGGTSIIYSLDANGNILPGRYDQNIGSTTHYWNKEYVKEINVLNGLVAVKEYWVSIPSQSETGLRNVTVTTTALFSQGGTTWLTLDITQMTVPRTIVILSSFSAGMATTTCSGQMTVRGVDSTGRFATEIVGFSTTPTRSNLAWALISSVTVKGSSITDNEVANGTTILKLGTTNAIGLTNVIVSTDDVYKLVEGATNVTLYAPNNSNVIISTNNTFVPLNVPDNLRSYWLWYRTKRTSPY